MSSNNRPYIDDADYAKFTDKTVKESTFDYLWANFATILMLALLCLCAMAIFIDKNAVPLVTYIALIAIYKLVWVKI